MKRFLSNVFLDCKLTLPREMNALGMRLPNEIS